MKDKQGQVATHMVKERQQSQQQLQLETQSEQIHLRPVRLVKLQEQSFNNLIIYFFN